MAGLAYCIKCKKKVAIKEGKLAYYSNGAPVEKGLCQECGSYVSRILSKEERQNLRNRQGQNIEGQTSTATPQNGI